MNINKRLEQLAEARDRASDLLPEALATLFALGVMALIGLDVMMTISGTLIEPANNRIESPKRIESLGKTEQSRRSGPSEGCFVMPDGTRICGAPDRVSR